jgi:hypothetical protein
MSKNALTQLFRKNFGKGVLFEGVLSQIAQVFIDESPPRFRFTSAEYVDKAITLYDGKELGDFGSITIKHALKTEETSETTAANGEVADGGEQGGGSARGVDQGKSKLKFR